LEEALRDPLSVISPTTEVGLSPAEDKPADEGTFALHGGGVLTSKTPRQHKPCQPTEGNAISEQSSGVNSKAGLHFAAAVDDDDEEDEGGSTIIDSTSGPSRTCLCSQARMLTVSNPLTELGWTGGEAVPAGRSPSDQLTSPILLSSPLVLPAASYIFLGWKVFAFCIVAVAWAVHSILALLDHPLFPRQALALSATLRQVHTKAVQLSLLPEYHQRLLRALSDSATSRQNADGELLDRAHVSTALFLKSLTSLLLRAPDG
jgi:hypothetical protein